METSHSSKRLRPGRRVVVLHDEEREPGQIIRKLDLLSKSGDAYWSVKIAGKNGTYAISEPFIEVEA